MKTILLALFILSSAWAKTCPELKALEKDRDFLLKHREFVLSDYDLENKVELSAGERAKAKIKYALLYPTFQTIRSFDDYQRIRKIKKGRNYKTNKSITKKTIKARFKKIKVRSAWSLASLLGIGLLAHYFDEDEKEDIDFMSNPHHILLAKSEKVKTAFCRELIKNEEFKNKIKAISELLAFDREKIADNFANSEDRRELSKEESYYLQYLNKAGANRE